MPKAIWTNKVKVEWAPASDPFDDTPSWVDITSRVKGITISRGRSGVFDLYAAGKATVTLDNGAGTFDPTLWYRWRQVRITALATGPVTLELFYGFVEVILHDQSSRPKFATASMQCVDLMGVLSRYEYTALTVPAEDPGPRIQRLIDAMAIPVAWQSFAHGYAIIAPMEDGVVNALQHLQDVAEAEIGGLFVSRQGILAFEDRYEYLDRLDFSPETTFSDTYAGFEVGFLYGDVILTPPGRDYRNRVTFTANGGTPQTAEDVPAGFPSDSLSRTVPLDSDSQAMANSEALLAVYKQETVVWPEHLTVSINSQNNIDRVCSLDLRRYCAVEFTPAGKTQQTYKVFVESLDYTMGSVDWTCRIGFSSADRWEAAWGTKSEYLTLDDASLGLLDSGKLGF